MGHWDHAVWSQKLLNTQPGVGRCAHKSPIMKWANALKELKPNTTSRNHASWYTDTDGFLEHSPSTDSLYYKKAPSEYYLGFGGSPLNTMLTLLNLFPFFENRSVISHLDKSVLNTEVECHFL